MSNISSWNINNKSRSIHTGVRKSNSSTASAETTKPESNYNSSSNTIYTHYALTQRKMMSPQG